MSEYKWNIKKIEEKMDYVKMRLNNTSDEEEIMKLNLTLINYASMFETSGSIKYTKFYNFMDCLTLGNFSRYKNSDYEKIKMELFNTKKEFMDIDYLSYLLSLCDNVLKTSQIELESLEEFDFSDENLVKISLDFYKDLGDEELFSSASKIYNQKENINFTDSFATLLQDNYHGFNFNDYIYNQSYCTVNRENTLMDLQAINHEVGHAIDFDLSNYKTINTNYMGFTEIPSRTIDYLLFDYMEKSSFPIEEINKLRNKHNFIPLKLANMANECIKARLITNFGERRASYFNIIDIYLGLTNIEKKLLLEVEASLVSYILYFQTLIDKEKGINNLKRIMKNPLPKNKRPDFSYIGATDDMILDLSILGNKSINEQIGKKYINKYK